MTSTERRAIAEARTRHAAAQGVVGEQALEGRVQPPSEPPGLTQHERQAALDDPAMNLRLADSNLPPGQGPSPTESKTGAQPTSEEDTALQASAAEDRERDRTSPRPGVELRSASGGLKLVDLAIATEVRRREPSGISDHYPVLPRMFHCFCVFENRHEPGTVTHVWRRDGRVVSRVELEVGKSPKWRTWSRQRLQPAWTGEWSCEVLAPGGRVLGVATTRAGQAD